MNWVVHFGPIEIAPHTRGRAATRPRVRFTPMEVESSTTPIDLPRSTFEPDDEIAFDVANDGDSVMTWCARLRGRGELPERIGRRLAHALQLADSDATTVARSSTVVDALVATKLSASRAQARRDIAGGGVYVANERVDGDRCLDEDGVYGAFALRRGKRHQVVVRVGEKNERR